MNKIAAFSAGIAAALMMTTTAMAAAPAQPTIAVSYSTDNHLTCDGLRGEIARMDWFIADKGSAAATVKAAQARKEALSGVLASKTNCGQAKKMDFGPGMYD